MKCLCRKPTSWTRSPSCAMAEECVVTDMRLSYHESFVLQNSDCVDSVMRRYLTNFSYFSLGGIISAGAGGMVFCILRLDSTKIMNNPMARMIIMIANVG